MKKLIRISVIALIISAAATAVNAQRGHGRMFPDSARMAGMEQMKMHRDSMMMPRGMRRMGPGAMNRFDRNPFPGYRGMGQFRMHPGTYYGHGRMWAGPGRGMMPGMRPGFRNWDSPRGFNQGMRQAPMGMRMESIPGLTGKQKKEIADLRTKQMDEMKKLREESAEKMSKLREEHRKKISSLLTEEQKKYLNGDQSSDQPVKK